MVIFLIGDFENKNEDEDKAEETKGEQDQNEEHQKPGSPPTLDTHLPTYIHTQSLIHIPTHTFTQGFA